MGGFGSRVTATLTIGLIGLGLAGCPQPNGKLRATEDIAQEWNTLVLDALLAADEGPTVEARTMFHLSTVMYDAWAAYDDEATGYLTGSRFKRPIVERTLQNRAEAISHAVYDLLEVRLAHLAAGAKGTAGQAAFDAFTAKMQSHGYLDENGEPVPSNAQELGALIADTMLRYAANDNSNEENRYEDTFGYVSLNSPMISNQSGTNAMAFPDLWQPVVTPDGEQQTYLTPHWGVVTPFSLPPFSPSSLRFDPGPLPTFDGDPDGYIAMFTEVLRFSSMMDPFTGAGAELINLSPRVRGLDGTIGDFSFEGHPINPYTQQPYDDNVVPVGDYLRAVAINHDGLVFMTPIPWWNRVATHVLRGDGVVDERAANKVRPRDLEYDVKLYFGLNAALHDVGIAIWDIKLIYDSARPMSGIRYLAELGELPLEPGFIEVIEPGDPLAGPNGEHVGEQKVNAWRGSNLGVGWIRGTDWHPYQALDFVAPPFPAYNSGHTAFSRAAAEVLTAYTGDPYFPGGLAELPIAHLRIEDDLSAPFNLQWATYRDMADETALGRVLSGVHITLDTTTAKPIGAAIARTALDLAREYFRGEGIAVAKDLQ